MSALSSGLGAELMIAVTFGRFIQSATAEERRATWADFLAALRQRDPQHIEQLEAERWSRITGGMQ